MSSVSSPHIISFVHLVKAMSKYLAIENARLQTELDNRLKTIRELEAELAASREQCQKLLDATGQHCGCGYDKPSDICLMHGGKLMAGVRAGTHVIVPVKPTEAMLEAAAPASRYGYEQSRKFIKQYWSAMIRAALKGESNGE
jgi:hypothetical protein